MNTSCATQNQAEMNLRMVKKELRERELRVGESYVTGRGRGLICTSEWESLTFHVHFCDWLQHHVTCAIFATTLLLKFAAESQ
jgi:hypothetical protein